MTRAIVILEDEPSHSKVEEQLLKQLGAGFVLLKAATVEEARRAINDPQAWLKHGNSAVGAHAAESQPTNLAPDEKPVIVGAIVDLLMESGARRRNDDGHQQGSHFVKWLLDQPAFAQLPMLVLTSYVEMTIELKNAVYPSVDIVIRGNDFNKIRAALRKFVQKLP